MALEHHQPALIIVAEQVAHDRPSGVLIGFHGNEFRQPVIGIDVPLGQHGCGHEATYAKSAVFLRVSTGACQQPPEPRPELEEIKDIPQIFYGSDIRKSKLRSGSQGPSTP
jgi:hypothetical protein